MTMLGPAPLLLQCEAVLNRPAVSPAAHTGGDRVGATTIHAVGEEEEAVAVHIVVACCATSDLMILLLSISAAKGVPRQQR